MGGFLPLRRGGLKGMTGWFRRNGGRLEFEVVAASLAAVVAFPVAASLSAVARSHIPAVYFVAALVLALAVIAHFAGVIYALPVGVVTLEAFDWYFLPPLRALDAGAVLVLAIFIATSILVAEIAAHAGRRATASEHARAMLADEQAALRRVATMVARQPSPPEVFAVVTEEVGKLLQLDAAQMYRYEAGRLTTVAGWGVAGPPIPIGTELVLDGDSVSARALATRRPARIDDYSLPKGATADYVRSVGIRGAVATPIIVDGEVWGLLSASKLHARPLPPAAELRLASFSELVATAISNAETKSELERVAAEQAALGRVATLVAEAAPSSEIFAAVADEIIVLFDVPGVVVFRYEPGTAIAVGVGASRAHLLGRRVVIRAEDPGVLATVHRTGQVARIDDYAGVEGAGPDFAREAGFGSAVGIPLLVDGRLWGALTIGLAPGDPPLGADTVDRLTAFTDLVTTAIANAAARGEIARLAEEQAALRRVATLVARGAQPRDVFATVAEELGRVLGVGGTAILRYEPDATATVVAAWSSAREAMRIGSSWPLDGEGVAPGVYRTGRSVRFDTYDEASGKFGAWAREVGLRSAVGAPIFVNDHLWGVASAGTIIAQLPNDAEARIASFAELIATAVSNAEARSALRASRARVVAAADETRRRIERDLHDGIQQRLVSLALKLRLTETMTPRPSDEIQSELVLLAEGLGAVLEELREISRGIHPAILAEGGLVPALKGLARRSAVPVALDMRLSSRVDETLEIAAYYVVSEALANAVKHAAASVVEISVEIRDGCLVLLIRDDGIGGVDPTRGSGLIGINDRVEALGGTLSVVSAPGEGTALEVQLPLTTQVGAAASTSR
jgi:signal transduction histidine kinase